MCTCSKGDMDMDWRADTEGTRGADPAFEKDSGLKFRYIRLQLISEKYPNKPARFLNASSYSCS